MIIASVINEAGCTTSTSAALISKCVIHCHYHHHKAAQQIQTDYCPTMSVVHWNDELLPDVTALVLMQTR